MIVAHGASATEGYGGTLTIINRGVISGRHGWQNSGGGGHAINLNIRGKSNQTTSVINYGTLRGGGGGGGRGGDGGYGGAGYVDWISSWTDHGQHININSFNHGAGTHWSNLYSPNRSYMVWFDGWHAEMGFDATFRAGDGQTHFYRADQYGWVNPPFWLAFHIRCYTANWTRSWYSGAAGGRGGNGGHGVGVGNSDSGNGREGRIGGSHAGNNTGHSGYGGQGGWGGGWGAAGGTGETGENGAPGNGGGGGAGNGGAGGGAAGAYIVNNGNGSFANYGTVQGNFW